MNTKITLQARIDPRLKKKGDAILKEIGLTASQAVNAVYAQIANMTTLKAMEELEAGGGESFSNFKEIVDDTEE